MVTIIQHIFYLNSFVRKLFQKTESLIKETEQYGQTSIYYATYHHQSVLHKIAITN